MTVSAPRRPTCDACALPLRSCVCALVAPVRNQVEVLVLQHPDEVREAKGTSRLLRLGLARCRVVVGERFEPAALLALLDGDFAGSALLYPADTATGMPAPAPRRLVLLDGTWRKSLRMLHANPLLQALPRCSLPAQASRYGALRKAARPTQLSTLEAACAALAAIEAAPTRYQPLLAALDRFVARGVRLAAGGTAETLRPFGS